MGVKYLPANGIVIRQGIYQESITQKADLGHFIDLEDGRRFRYCKAEGVITKAHMAQSAILNTDHENEIQTVIWSIGDTEVTCVVTNAPTKNDYAEGFLVINDGIGEGEMYKIKSNSGASPTVLKLYDAIRVATAVGSLATLVQSKYRDVVVAVKGANPSGVPVGVPLITITTGGYYFWAQTRGYCTMHIESSVTVGVPVQLSESTTNGSAEASSAAADAIIGIAPYSCAEDLDYSIINLMLE